MVYHTDHGNLLNNLQKFDVLQPYSKGIVVEFGLGDSTFYFLSKCEKLFSFETSKAFCKKYEFLKDANPGKFEIHHFDIGPTKTWGRPILPEYLIRRKVIDSIQTIQAKLRSVDFATLFIDGRFRVASTLALVASSHHSFTIVIDDYHDRVDYKILEDYLGLPEFLSLDFAKFDVDPTLSNYVSRRWKWQHLSQA